jgi:hypothetical protein
MKVYVFKKVVMGIASEPPSFSLGQGHASA